ncbi:hypothetical protein [Celeribacter ethanolicus]|uniref:DUF2007 domain-containing protein n=1 Tax=Celeribacter ethanolicus TaxID=1758178 RepID=A0A291GBA6_9RHOB|nr:hypothetical protein [Celeribacter ethanolicus]ATG47296.1 hypothetical protein CEW89_06775 [Celeribacter ethanolicus]TNE64847.1 MAG: hypothetical protein EP336_13635 [Paracoccaceae bacterium]
MQQNDFIEIGRAYGAADVALIESAFEGAGIPLFVLHRQVHLVASQHAVAFGGMPICVLPSDRDAAVALLSEIVPVHRCRLRWAAMVLFLLACLSFGTAVPMPINGTFPRYRVRQEAPGDA